MYWTITPLFPYVCKKKCIVQKVKKYNTESEEKIAIFNSEPF